MNKIIKVIVDELPEYCEDCIYFEQITSTNGATLKCLLTGKHLSIPEMNKPPSWCPLITVDILENALPQKGE
jgi:hypothetical protein